MLDQSLFEKKVLNDDNFTPELALCAEDKGQLIGFGYGMKRRVPYYTRGLEPDKGWICILFVAPNYRRRGTGTLLCSELEKRLAETGAEQIILGSYSPNYFVPGVETDGGDAVAFFQNRGYCTAEKCYSMYRVLFGYEIPERIKRKRELAERDGLSFIRFRMAYEESFRTFLKKNFSPGWYRNADILLKEGKAERQIYVCLSPKGEVIGFCMRGMDGNPNRFGPFGIDARYRNHSLGSILFCTALHDIACQGIYFIYFLSTDDAGKRFYERHGLTQYRAFYHMNKHLTERNV